MNCPAWAEKNCQEFTYYFDETYVTRSIDVSEKYPFKCSTACDCDGARTCKHGWCSGMARSSLEGTHYPNDPADEDYKYDPAMDRKYPRQINPVHGYP